MTFGQVLRILRKENSLTQDDLAIALGVSKSIISMYECGQRYPDFEALKAIADFFSVDMDYLAGRSAAPKLQPSPSNTPYLADSSSAVRIGKRIADRRKYLGMTLDELGRRVGVGKSTVRKWETGAIANIRSDKIAAIAKSLGLTLEELLSSEPADPEKRERKNAAVSLAIGKSISDRRKVLGLTQGDLSERLGYTDRSSIAKIETGVSDISLTTLLAFAKALDVPAVFLLSRDFFTIQNSEEKP